MVTLQFTKELANLSDGPHSNKVLEAQTCGHCKCIQTFLTWLSAEGDKGAQRLLEMSKFPTPSYSGSEIPSQHMILKSLARGMYRYYRTPAVTIKYAFHGRCCHWLVMPVLGLFRFSEGSFCNLHCVVNQSSGNIGFMCTRKILPMQEITAVFNFIFK